MVVTPKITEGTLIHGTMREEDLVPAFLGELTRVDLDAARKIRREYKDIIDNLTIKLWWWTDAERQALHFLMDDLFDALNACAADYGLMFGAHPGDGSDYGYWSIEEEE